MSATTPIPVAAHKKPQDPERAGGLALLWVDGEAVVVDKPAGLPVDPPRDGSLSMHNRLQALRLGFHRPPSIIHRLDRDTSGCLLLARHTGAARRFAAIWEAGQVEKRYLAVLDGVPGEESGTIDLALGKTSSVERGWRMVPDPGGKRAVSHWRVLEVRDGRALVEFRPETGRTHQLRVHAFEALGCPIVGDPVYGSGRPGDPPLLLHAAALTLSRAGKPPVVAVAPLPERFVAAGWRDAHEDAAGAAPPSPTPSSPPPPSSPRTRGSRCHSPAGSLDPRVRGDDGEGLGDDGERRGEDGGGRGADASGDAA